MLMGFPIFDEPSLLYACLFYYLSSFLPADPSALHVFVVENNRRGIFDFSGLNRLLSLFACDLADRLFPDGVVCPDSGCGRSG